MVTLCGMKLNPNKTKSIRASKSRASFPSQLEFRKRNNSLTSSDSFKVSGVTFDGKFIYEKYIHCNVPFHFQLIKRLVYLENILGFGGIRN